MPLHAIIGHAGAGGDSGGSGGGGEKLGGAYACHLNDMPCITTGRRVVQEDRVVPSRTF